MAVAVDATGTAKTGVAATSTGSIAAGITVGAGANPILVLGIQFGGDPGAITACNWDSGGTPQAMTQVGTLKLESDNLGSATIFALTAPTAGAKNISITWTNSVSWTFGLISFTGADQGSVSGTCINFISGNPACAAATGPYPTPSGVNLNSPVGDFCVLFGASNAETWLTTGGTGTNLYALNTNVSGFGRYTTGAGAATTLAGGANGTANPCCYVGCDIAAVGTVGGGGPTPTPQFSVGMTHIIQQSRMVGY